MLEISTRGRYSIRILSLMASQPRGYVFAKYEIAEAEDLSCAYVQQLAAALKTAGLVSSQRGKLGGFTLGRPAETITVAEILKATEGPMTLAPCMGREGCRREASCPVHPVWTRATELLDELFGEVTLAQLAQRQANGQPLPFEPDLLALLED